MILLRRLDLLDSPYAFGETPDGSICVKIRSSRINMAVLSLLTTCDRSPMQLAVPGSSKRLTPQYMHAQYNADTSAFEVSLPSEAASELNDMLHAQMQSTAGANAPFQQIPIFLCAGSTPVARCTTDVFFDPAHMTFKEIYLPEDSYGSLKVNTVSGEIEVPEKYAFNDVAINTTSGSITCDCTATGDIEIGTVSGEITFSSVNGNKFNASSTSGSVKLSNAKVSGAVTIDTVSGEIILNDVESGSLNTNSVSGDVMFTNLTTDDVNIDTTSGEVSGTITGDHEYDVDTVSGDISLPAAIKGEAMVNISTVSGDVDIETA